MLTIEKFNEIVLQKAKEHGIINASEDSILKFALDMHTWGYMSGWRDADDADRDVKESIKEHGYD